MARFIKYFILFLGILFASSYFEIPYLGSALNYIAGPFFEERIAPEDLLQKYKNDKIKLLIVPGHDNNSVGGMYRDIRETDLNVDLSHELLKIFKEDNKFEVFITRDKEGNYNDWFLAYLEEQGSRINKFREYVRAVMHQALKGGAVTREAKVHHNPASDNISLNLYAINKWANENDVDIVLHVHFNDYPTRPVGWPGEYTGFAIYVPEKQLPNSKASIELAESIKTRFEKYFPKSNFPGESDTVVEDQQLVAIGSNASRDGVSVLIEYGYIYESRFANSGPRSLMMKELASQTFWSIKDYFDDGQHSMLTTTTLLPHKWELSLKKGMNGFGDIVHLQMALFEEGLYPPDGHSLSMCPINGNFGNCTFAAVCAFQETYNIGCVGVVGPKTLEKLNELYGALP